MAIPSTPDRPPPKILLLGATGYVGGTVLHRLLTSPHPALAALPPLTLPVRGAPRAKQLASAYGPRVTPIPFTSLDDTTHLRALAADHDIVINAGSGFHPASAQALVRGAADRKATTGRAAWVVHTSGCSNISDQPLTGAARPDAEYDDADAEAVVRFEEEENARSWYPQRKAELDVLRLGEETGVGAVSVQAPCIFGAGEGLFQGAGLMIPIMMGYVLERGYGFSLGDGSGVIDTVHVADLADLYLAILVDVLENEGRNVPVGRKGILFPVSGRVKMWDIAEGCVRVAFENGALPKEDGPREREIRKVSLDEAATTTAGNKTVAEFGWAGHRKTKATVARERLGWKPVQVGDAWEQDLKDELTAALEGRRGVTIGTCIAGAR
ncbi:hypothetical protein ACHAQA_004903 [Verticillium albo-atrum]